MNLSSVVILNGRSELRELKDYSLERAFEATGGKIHIRTDEHFIYGSIMKVLDGYEFTGETSLGNGIFSVKNTNLYDVLFMTHEAQQLENNIKIQMKWMDRAVTGLIVATSIFAMHFIF